MYAGWFTSGVRMLTLPNTTVGKITYRIPASLQDSEVDN